ncbi:MAG: ArgE/DapE family deacylase, partial [Chloroflexota bacterium]
MSSEESATLAEVVRGRSREIQEWLTTFTEELVAFPTPNPPGEGYRAITTYLAERLRGLGLEPTEVAIPGEGDLPRFALFAVLGGAGPTLHFHGHYDVVPAVKQTDYNPRREGGRLYGRGSSDMKSGLAAMLGAVAVLRDLGLPRAGRVIVSLVPDEETGGRLGTAYLWERGYFPRDSIGMLMPEPTTGAVWNANRGALTVGVSVRGRPAHVALQHEGANAFSGLVRAGQALLDLQKVVAGRLTEVPVDPPEARASVMLVGGRVQGGTNFNLVPAECWFSVDRRTNPEEDLSAVKAEILAAVVGAAGEGLSAECEVLQKGESSLTADHTPLALALSDAVAEVCGTAPAFAMCPGLCEIRFFNRNGVPALAYGPGILSVSHGPEEYVEVGRIAECAAIY